MFAPSQIGGIIVPIPTPFAENGTFDAASLQRLIGALLHAGIHGILALGSNSEFARLTDDVALETVRVTVETVNGQVPIIAGVSDTSTERVLRNVRTVTHFPIDGIACLPPIWWPANQEELVEFYQQIADASPVPLFLYGAPPALAISTVATLQAHENIVGIKCTTEDMVSLRQLIQFGKDGAFRVFVGGYRLLDLLIGLGIHGMIEGTTNVCPRLCTRLWEARWAGRLEEAERLQHQINRVYEIYGLRSQHKAIHLQKEALRLQGLLASSWTSGPSLSIPAEVTVTIRGILQEVGLVASPG